MKTIADLNALIPSLIDLVLDNPEIGESYWEQDEDGWGKCSDYESNYVCYEEDGWCIEISFRCCGDWSHDDGDYWTPASSSLNGAYGEVTEITAYHYDEESGEESEFSDDDLNEMWSALDKALESF